MYHCFVCSKYYCTALKIIDMFDLIRSDKLQDMYYSIFLICSLFIVNVFELLVKKIAHK